MSGRKRLFLHIGQPKTATTTLQTFLSINRDRLIRHGWLYPNAGRQYAAHHLFGNFFRAQPLYWIGAADPAQVMAELKREVEETRCENVILSTESLYFAQDRAGFAEYLKDFDVTIVVSLRRQDEWIESVYQDNLKNGETRLDPEAYLVALAGSLDYAGPLSAWAAAFGKHKIMVHSFEATAEKLPVERLFMDLVGAPVTPDLVDPPTENERLNRDCTTFLTMFAASPRADLKHEVIKNALIEYSRAHPDPAALRYVWSPQRRREIVESQSDANAGIARDYLGRADGRLFQKPLPESDEPWEIYPGLRTRKAVAIAEFLAGRMYNMIAEEWARAAPAAEAASLP